MTKDIYDDLYQDAFRAFQRGQRLEGLFALHARSLMNQFRPSQLAGIPVWMGGPFDPTKMVIWSSAGIGIGGEILHLGFLPSVGEKLAGARIVIDARLVPLLSRLFSNIRFYSSVEAALAAGEVERHCSLLSLGFMSICLTGGVRRPFRYLGLSRASVDKFRPYISSLTGGPYVGIAWSTPNPRGTYRLPDVESLAHMLKKIPGPKISLQHAASAEDLNVLRGSGLVDDGGFDPYTNFPGLLARLAGSAKVITIDNSVAHLAGSIGKRGVVIIPRERRWPFCDASTLSFWYPSLSGVEIEEIGAIPQIIDSV